VQSSVGKVLEKCSTSECVNKTGLEDRIKVDRLAIPGISEASSKCVMMVKNLWESYLQENT
jgi:hypothetical protein